MLDFFCQALVQFIGDRPAISSFEGADDTIVIIGIALMSAKMEEAVVDEEALGDSSNFSTLADIGDLSAISSSRGWMIPL